LDSEGIMKKLLSLLTVLTELEAASVFHYFSHMKKLIWKSCEWWLIFFHFVFPCFALLLSTLRVVLPVCGWQQSTPGSSWPQARSGVTLLLPGFRKLYAAVSVRLTLYSTSEEMRTSELIWFQNEYVYPYIEVEGVNSPKLGGVNAT